MKVSYFPFTQEAAHQVRSAGFSLESLLDKTSFKAVRDRAAERVWGAIIGEIPDKWPATEAENLMELLSYPLSRVIVSCLDDDALIRRYALGEAKLAFKRMQRDKEEIISLANDLGLHPQDSKEPFKIHFSEYIRAAHSMRSPKWKLVNRDLKGGYITITREVLMRLMEEMVRDRVIKGLPVPLEEELCERLADCIRPLRLELDKMNARQKVNLGQVEELAFPPCIMAMLSQVSAGQNLAHSARFALTSFLLQINMSPVEVVALFNTSPDFDEEQTRYQVEHISGSSGTKYKPPSCATMITYGNCRGKDELCNKVGHPLSYYERKIKRGLVVQNV
ncbi:MAG: DNA primase large subunit PriL [Methanotrichaceae archaeon]|nr:DNA primase large subunit PriL [Methanotrichaceae archaeon]